LYVSQYRMVLRGIRLWKRLRYGPNETAPWKKTSSWGHTSVIFCLPAISVIRWISNSVQVGTPDMLVTLTRDVSRAIFSIFSTQLLINAVARLGVRINCAQCGRFCIITADTSP